MVILARPHAVSEHLQHTSSMLRSQACRRSDSDDVRFGHSATPTFAASRHYQEAVLVPRRRTAAGAFIVPMQGGPADLRSRPGVTYRRQRMHACMASSVQGWSWSWCMAAPPSSNDLFFSLSLSFSLFSIGSSTRNQLKLFFAFTICSVGGFHSWNTDR